MTAFDIYINNRKICTAGLNHAGVLTSALTWVAGYGKRKRWNENLEVRVAGLISRSHTFVDWLHQPLAVGDEVKFVVAERRSADAPKTKRRENKAERLKRERRLLQTRAAAGGWKLVDR